MKRETKLYLIIAGLVALLVMREMKHSERAYNDTIREQAQIEQAYNDGFNKCSEQF